MRDIALGSTGLTTTELGLGCMGLSQSYDTPPDPDDALDLLGHALDLGVRMWDTSDAYALGANERLIADALVRFGRDEVVLATKFGGAFDHATGEPTGVRGDAAYVRQACDASLRRLGTDRIDRYYQHIPDPAVPVEETVAAMAQLVAAGKVAHLGLSNVSAEQLRAAPSPGSPRAASSTTRPCWPRCAGSPTGTGDARADRAGVGPPPRPCRRGRRGAHPRHQEPATPGGQRRRPGDRARREPTGRPRRARGARHRVAPARPATGAAGPDARRPR
ncbi:aldo/keto reductase [Nocardiopsis aegyptia]